MSHARNNETPHGTYPQALCLQVLSAISQYADKAASMESIFRTVGKQLLTAQIADAVSLIVYDDDAVRIRELFLLTGQGSFKRTNYHDLPLRGLSVSGTAVADLTILSQPVITKAPEPRDRLYKENAPLHFFTTYAQQVHLPLANKKISTGTLTLHSSKPDTYATQNLPFFDLLANYLSMVMRLHIADEETKLIEKERDLLLALGNALTKVSTRNDLAGVLQDQFRRLFASGDIVICVNDHEKQTHSIFLLLSETDRFSTTSQVTAATYPIDDGFYKQVQTEKNARLYNIEELIRQQRVPDYIRDLFDKGIREIASIRLRAGDTSIGALFILCDGQQRLLPRQTNALRFVSIHLSLAIANVLAKENYHYPSPAAAPADKTPVLTGKYIGMIGTSPAMLVVKQLIAQVAAFDSTVLVLGETGTGKELVAKAIHDHSPRGNNRMVKVNCAALPANLIESELFGHEKGSFTDAIERKTGKFEMAHNSTLFLDEIGELPLDLQVKLLRVLQEKEIERIGGKEVIPVNVRIIAASNRCLYNEMLAGRFRRDLYYRLNVLPLTLPPLRERREDIPALAAHFIDKYARKTGHRVMDLSGSALQDLMAYQWPGNIRELEHLIERSILLTKDNHVLKIELPAGYGPERSSKEGARIRSLAEVERDHILAILKKCKGKVAGAGGAARLLNIPSTTLNSKIRRLGIKKDFIG